MRYRADGLRTMKVLGDQATEGTGLEEELSSYYDFNAAVNNRTWLYHYDGQMSVSEVFTGSVEGNDVCDITHNVLGARGIDSIEAQRTMSFIPNDSVYAAGLKRQYPLYDGHGNMFASIIRGTGTSYQLVNEKRYDAWGSVSSSSGAGTALANPKEGYCGSIGHKLDPESGLIYMRARYYEPGTGRFISQDPARDGWNWYVYCENDPVQKMDESGRHPILIAALVGFLACFTLSVVYQYMTAGKVDFASAAISGVQGAVLGALAAALLPLVAGGGAVAAMSTGLAAEISAAGLGSAILGAIGLGAASGAISAIIYVFARNLQIKGLLEAAEDYQDIFDPAGGMR